jgi:hypothetical protein
MINKKIIDTEELSAWSVGGGITRIQTRLPAIAEAVSRLKQTWQVGESVQGGYLRLFLTTQRPRKIRRTLERILSRIFPQGRRCHVAVKPSLTRHRGLHTWETRLQGKIRAK